MKHLNSSNKPEQPRTSYYAADISEPEMLVQFLETNDFVQNGRSQNVTVVNLLVSDTTDIEVTLDEELKFRYLNHTAIRWREVEYLRDRKTQSWRKSPDVRIRVETKRKIYNPKSSLYEFILDKPLVVFAKSDKQLDSNIPRLDVSVKYTERVKSTREKRISTYKYPLEKVAEKLDYFTAHVMVEISNVRETSFYDGKNHENEFSDVRILLPKLSPLHYKDDHDDAIRGMINLGFLISNLIS